MTIQFLYKTEEQFKEIHNMLEVIGRKHFGAGWHTYETLPWGFKDWTTISIRNDVFIKDLEASKENVYKLNRQNDWHYTKNNDFPELGKKVLVKYKNILGTLSSPIPAKLLNVSKNSWALEIQNIETNEVVSWKECESEEVILTDFLSDFLENLSFVPDYKVLEEY